MARLFFALALLALAVAVPAAAHGCPPPSPQVVQCLVAPCSTPACKAKCDAFRPNNTNINVTCVDNYVGGCNCDCCLPKNELCAVQRDYLSAPCCKGLVCDFSTACVADPRTKCGTICLKPEDAYSHCKPLNAECDPRKTQCCPATSCRRSKSYHPYRCAKCQGVGSKCSSKNPCCPLLTCVPGGGTATCVLKPPRA